MELIELLRKAVELNGSDIFLIPGAGVFWSSYFVVSTQMDSALAAGFTAVKITLAIVLGIVLSANLLTRKLRSAH